MASTSSPTESSTDPSKRPLEARDLKYEAPLWGWLMNSDSSHESPWSRKIVLSLDGGGVRGYISLKILDHLMDFVRELEAEASAIKPENQSNTVSDLEHDGLSDHSGTYRWSKPAYDPNGQFPTQERTFKPHHYIDYFVGTSTGGLSAIMLGRLQMTVSDAIAQYDIVGSEVFQQGRKATWKGRLTPRFKSSHMESALQKITHRYGYGAQHTNDMLLHHATTVNQNEGHGNNPAPPTDANTIRIQANRVILRNGNIDTARTVAVAHGTWEDNMRTRRPLLFRSYDHPPPNITSTKLTKHHKPYYASDLPLWKVGSATSAAPTYFKHMMIEQHKIRDGAVGEANNPILCAYEEVKQMHWKHEPALIISIGTGKPSKVGKPLEVAGSKLRALLPIVDNLREVFETSKWFQGLVLDSEGKHREFKNKVHGDNGIDGINDRLTDQNVEPIIYCRFNIPPLQDVDITRIKLGEWKGENGNDTKAEMNRAIETYLKQAKVRDKMNTCAKKMVEVRRERQKTERWERFALNLVYSCPEGRENVSRCKDLLFPSRLKLRQHGIRTHGFAWKVPCIDNSGAITHDWACYWDHCGERHVSVFNTEFEFSAHLNQQHKLERPQIRSQQWIEEWLDKGRQAEPPLVSPSHTGFTQRPPT